MSDMFKLSMCVLPAAALALVTGTASADFTDDFSSYADQTEFEAAWSRGAFKSDFVGAPVFDFEPDTANLIFDAANDQVTMEVEHPVFALVNMTRQGQDQALGNGLKISTRVSNIAQGDNLTGVQLALNGVGGGAIFAEIDPIDFDFDGVNVDGFAVRSLVFRPGGGAPDIVNTGFTAAVIAADISTEDLSLVVTGSTYDVLFGDTSLIGGPQAHGAGGDPLLDAAKEYQAKVELIRLGGAPDGFPNLAQKSVVLDSVSLTSIPEPASLALVTLGGVAMLRRRA